MLDPTKITNYNQTHSELECVLIWWCFAAGHNAISTARGVDKFLIEIYKISNQKTPFVSLRTLLNKWDTVLDILSRSGLGCWRIKSRTLKELASSNINLKTCTVEDLEKIYGIGLKTARGFILHSRKNTRVACIDTHLLKFLRSKGIDAPKSTPTGKRYKLLEQEFLRLCDEANKTPSQYDLEIWNYYSKNSH